MKFLEKDLEEIIWDAYKNDKLSLINNRGLFINGLIKRQLRIGNYGIADLVSFEFGYSSPIYDGQEFYKYRDFPTEYIKQFRPSIRITIYELKKDKIGISAFLQSVRYTTGIKQFIENKYPNSDFYFIVNIVLIGSELDTSGSLCFIPDVFPNISFYTYKYDLDGIVFNSEEDYKLINEGFKL